MIQMPPVSDEARRLAMVRSLGLAGAAPDTSLTALAALAANVSGAQIGLVCLIDADTVWLVGREGFDRARIGRWDSLCQHLLARPGEALWVPDARLDVRTRDSRYVTGDPGVRFYAGAPLAVNDCVVGSLCVLDRAPRDHDAAMAATLKRVAGACEAELTERHRTSAMRQALAASADALIDCDDDGRVVAWSDGARTLFGFSHEEALGAEITMIIPPEHRERHREGLRRWRASGAARLGRRLELPALRRDGSALDIELWMSVSHEAGRPRLHANIRDISQRRAQERELAAAKGRAEAASQAKSAFLATMSHELRTPLNGVTAGAGLLAASRLDVAQQELVDIVATSAGQLERLIGDILDIARSDAGELKLDPAPVELGRLVDEVIALARLKADEKGLRLELRMPAHARVAVVADAARLKQVLGNLLSNALKFTAQGRVALTVTRRDDLFQMEVQDTGIGFGPEVRETIFERFQQADSTITRRFGGTGLGLAICRDLVQAMGGTITCESRPGTGSVFRIEAPLPPVDVAGAAPQTPPAPDPVSGLRILVVDDNATNRQVAGLILEASSMSVAFAEDGQEALARLAAERFDLILMDMMMPVMDGLEATRRLRTGAAGPAARDTPVIMLTANTLPEHIATAMAAGADLHLAKPITPGGLLGAVGALSMTARPTVAQAV